MGWWAEANGEAATLPDGSEFCPPPGSLIRIAEWYGADEDGDNQGLKLSAADIAHGIIERERQLMDDGWIVSRPMPGPADNQIGDVRESDVDSIAKKMRDNGVDWERSNKAPGSRVVGLQLIRDRLENAASNLGPGLYFTDNCIHAITQLPILPRDPRKLDDVDTTAEDHIYDDVRYRVLANFDAPSKLTIGFPM